MRPIEDIAARASVRVLPRERTLADRIDEYERLKALREANLVDEASSEDDERDREDDLENEGDS